MSNDVAIPLAALAIGVGLAVWMRFESWRLDRRIEAAEEADRRRGR
jgi:hypothetical protein